MNSIADLHRAEYDTPPDIIASAPAIIKFLGEHTDFAEGLVLAAAISFQVHVAISARKDSSLRFFAENLGERKRSNLGSLKYKREDRWANYPKSVLEAALAETTWSRGFNISISGNIPMALGLASSTALVMASALAFTELMGIHKKHDQLAEFARKAESLFFKTDVSGYDHLTATSPPGNNASIIDLRDMRRRAVNFLAPDIQVILTDSRVPRINLEKETASRIADCKKCIEALAGEGRSSLRDYNVQELEDLMGALPERVRRRGLFIVEEIARVHEAEEALVKHDLLTFGKCVNKSHNSLRNLYEVSCPEIDWLVRRAVEIDGVYCSRLTGKGFGGCTFTVLKDSARAEYMQRLEDYERIFGFKPIVYEVKLSGGLKIS